MRLEVATCPAKQLEEGVNVAVIWSLLFKLFELNSKPVPPGTAFPLMNHCMISPVLLELGVAVKFTD
jgi:hypothetical protein